IAEAARSRGADVVAVVGSTTVEAPEGMKTVKVISAQQMASAVSGELQRATVFIGAAAVADYRPLKRAEQKIKKDSSAITIELERTTDILSEVSANRPSGMLVIGFAAESENVIQNAKTKLQAKKLDAIVANDISHSDAGFDSETNAITILTAANGLGPIELPVMTKLD